MNVIVKSVLLFFTCAVQVNNVIGDETRRKSIIDEPNCGDIRTICNNLSENDDILILECLQSVNPATLASLHEKCQSAIWSHIKELTTNERVKEELQPICRNYLDKVTCNVDDEDGTYLKCIVNNRDSIENIDCVNAVLRLENVAFQDYRWISKFLDQCDDDIEKLSCGKLDENSWTQFKTLTCLQMHIESIKEECRKEVFKLSEMQADSIKLDRQLYLNCAEDHARYCSQFMAGSGRVFKCLMQQNQNNLAQKCKQHLLRRQKLIAQDYRVSKGLMKACKDDIKKSHCRKQTSSDKTVRLAQILLCLENVVRNGTKIQSDCEAELIDHRRMLMEDYRLSPEIVDGCKAEIAQSCKGIEVGGKTIHCLMNVALVSNKDPNAAKIDPKCLRALESLVKEADVGEDWHVDPVLHEACSPVVKTVCRDVKGGDARVMSCLMDNIGGDKMTEECENALIQIQYFVARDFKLDPQLYRACRTDAANYCHISKDGEEGFGPSYSSQVFACLYRHSIHIEEGKQLDKTCLQQLRRVMRQRAISVDLQPEIEEVCLSDLGYFCHDKIEKGEEILCLQKNFEELKPECQNAVESFTEIEAEHADLNPYIMKHCHKEMDHLCHEEFKSDEGDVMECLISHKNDPLIKSNPPCRASIEHFQLISIKDIKFSYKFKMACKNIAMRLCETARTKTDVVQCLSAHILNYTINSEKSLVPRECKQQLKVALLQQRENINYDPKLKSACSKDIEKFCGQLTAGNAEVLECLKEQRGRLSKSCDEKIFKVKKQEIFYNSVDYSLNTYCQGAIEQFCPHHNKENVLECLKANKDEKGFNKKCRQIVINRMIEQDTNYQLNPALQQKCLDDIRDFCSHVQPSGKDQNSPIIKCLKEQFKQSKLRNKCEKEVAHILREQALNIKLNPLLRAVCKNELATICSDSDEESDKAEECLKDALTRKAIQTRACEIEVANLIVESEADIQVDPLLQQACALDLLKYCSQVPQGGGRHIQCLKIKLENDPKSIDGKCSEMLKKRLEMYKLAQVAEPRDFQQLYRQVSASPARNYFLMVTFMVFCTIFGVGILCGRVMKRQRFMKMK